MKVPALDVEFAPGFAQRRPFRSKRGYGEYLSCPLDYELHEINRKEYLILFLLGAVNHSGECID